MKRTLICLLALFSLNLFAAEIKIENHDQGLYVSIHYQKSQGVITVTDVDVRTPQVVFMETAYIAIQTSQDLLYVDLPCESRATRCRAQNPQGIFTLEEEQVAGLITINDTLSVLDPKTGDAELILNFK
jgi:hypothetical protein